MRAIKIYYTSLSSHLKQVFGTRVQRIPVNTGMTCPNWDGTLSYDGCIFCDPHGSGAIFDDTNNVPSIEEQIKSKIDFLGKRFGCDKFIAYFQAFSNTNTTPENLEMLATRALSVPGIIGLSISTRPDLLNDDILDVIGKISQKTYLWLEIGIQSANDETLKLINRNHSFDDVVKAVNRAHEHEIKVCGHVIIGLPGEGNADIINTAKSLAALDIEGVKIHSLYISKGSTLEREWKKGNVHLLDEETYVSWVVDFLEYTKPETVIHRLVSAGRKEVHVAPTWCLDKQRIIGKIDQEFFRRGSRQGFRI
jgi:uncharacterized protein